MQADSRERGCSYLGRDRASFVLLETDQSAESIVVEPNLCLMTRLVSGSKQREGSYEGRNIEQLKSPKTNVLVKAERRIGRFSFREREQSIIYFTFHFIMKYSNLMPLILSQNNLRMALSRVVANKGSAGIDGMSYKELPIYLNNHWTEIKISLETGTYHPSAVRGVEIDKPNGGKRLLGIPTVVDRFIQQAIHQQLSLVYEPVFSQSSFGFRPMRSAQGALEQSMKYINDGFQNIIDLDLKSFFDKVNHDKLIGLLRKRIDDKVLLKLIRRYLQSGIMMSGVVNQRQSGTPQGGPLSPLLSNILLDELDKELEKRGHHFVRYADDVSIYLKSKTAAKRVLKSIRHFLNHKLLLEVNEEKTNTCRPLKFTLLGHGFVSVYKKGVKGKYRLCIARKSWARLKLKIKSITRKTSPIPMAERIEKLNQLMRGWIHYFKLATGFQKLKTLDGWIRSRLRYCIWKQWKRPKRRLRAFIQLGISPSWARRFAYSRKGGWLLACSPVMKMAVTIGKLRLKGYIPFVEYYLKVKHPKTVQ